MAESLRRRLVDGILVLALVAVVGVSFALAPRPADREAFAGTDAVVTQMLEDSGVEPWFTPLFQPASGEVEAGLFAVQAALGAGVLGYVFGRLHARRASHPTPSAPAETPHPDSA